MEIKEMSPESYVGGTRKLPKDVIQTILMCLPLRDAVRTSILSRAWRYEWNTLPSLIFDRDHFKVTYGETQEEFDRKFVKIVDQVLLHHRGPVYEFELSAELESCHDIDRWILLLSRNGIKKFTLDISNDDYIVTSCLFSCEEITHLDLLMCELNLPSSFKGFSKLTKMNLTNIYITEDGFSILISLCVHLKQLTLLQIDFCTHFKLCAKELVSFKIENDVEDFHFEAAPLLAEAYLHFTYINIEQPVASIKSSSRIVEALGNLPSIERLTLYDDTLQTLAAGDVPVSLPVVCPLKQLSMGIDFEDVQQLLAAFCIFRSSPLLQKLKIEVLYAEHEGEISTDGFWQEEEDFNCKFTHLRTVEVTQFTGRTTELKFIEYIAGNAPVLERLQINFANVPYRRKKKFANVRPDESKVIRELLRFRRCSAKAEIIVPS